METLASNLDRVTAEHAFNLLLATAGLAFTYLLAWEIGHSRRAAALALRAAQVCPHFITQL